MRDEIQMVFLVEDDPASRRLVRAVLEPKGYRIEEAERVDEARAFLARVVPSLVLLDLRLQGGDGVDVLHAMRSDARLAAVPVVVLTANAMKADEARCRAAGFDHFLSKPVDTRRLSAVVDEVITRGRSHGRREDPRR